MDKKMGNRKKLAQNISALAFSFLSLIGILVCFICAQAINRPIVWPMIAISSILFGWLVLLPVVRLWEKGIWQSLAVLSVLIFPYLILLDRLIPGTFLFPITVWAAPAGIIYLWSVYGLFTRLKRKWLAAGIASLLALPVFILINWILVGILGSAFLDSWDALTFLSIGILAVIFFGLDFRSRRKQK